MIIKEKQEEFQRYLKDESNSISTNIKKVYIPETYEELGDILIVAINSDSSVKKIKGELRPVVPQNERAFIISQLKAVDYVTIFDEETPNNVIKVLLPDILVKGADWSKDKIVGSDIVENNGGKVETIKFVNNTSTTNIIKTILEKYKIE